MDGGGLCNLFTPHCSTQEQDGQTNAWPVDHVQEGAHAQTLASTQVRYSFMLDLGETHLFSPAPRNISIASSQSLFCARYWDLFNLYTSDGLKIGLLARARVPCECAYAETIWFRSVWQRIREYFYFSRTLQLPPPSPFLSVRSHFPHPTPTIWNSFNIPVC